MNLGKYKDYLLEAIYSDLIWCSTRNYMPTDEESLIVYNTKNGYRVGYFVAKTKVFINAFNKLEKNFAHVLSWAYLDITKRAKKKVPSELLDEVNEYRGNAEQSKNHFIDFHEHEEEDNVEIEVCNTGFLQDDEDVVILDDDGTVWINDKESFNIYNHVRICKKES